MGQLEMFLCDFSAIAPFLTMSKKWNGQEAELTDWCKEDLPSPLGVERKGAHSPQNLNFPL